jgi:hypothetical protein
VLEDKVNCFVLHSHIEISASGSSCFPTNSKYWTPSNLHYLQRQMWGWDGEALEMIPVCSH